VISHPHYYTTHNLWAKIFGCPVYLAAEDKEWLCREDPQGRVFIEGNEKEVVKGVTAVKVGGHFPGSLVLHWEDRLFIADSFVTVPVGPPSLGIYACNSLLTIVECVISRE